MADVLRVGERVRYGQWAGVVRGVLSDGTAYIDWTCWPRPFFDGPYKPMELTRV